MKTIDDREDGLALLSEGVALIQIQSAALANDILPDTPARRGLEIMLDHASRILLRAEEKLRTDPNSDREADVQEFMRDSAELDALPD